MVGPRADRANLVLAEWEHQQYVTGAGQVAIRGEGVRIMLGANDGTCYGDAQLDDYHIDGVFGWRPPVRLEIRARFSHPAAMLRGTAGFGFWNDPFGMTKAMPPRSWLPKLRMPQAAWFFFASPPSDMLLALDVPGRGWKSATLDASGLSAKLLLPLAPLGMLLCRSSWFYRRLWPLAQHVLKIDEQLLPVSMDEWHEYGLDWGESRVRFRVDGNVVFQSRYSPRGPLGFVIWIDNQYMVATPQGVFRSGLIAADDQWMEIAALEVQARDLKLPI